MYSRRSFTALSFTGLAAVMLVAGCSSSHTIGGGATSTAPLATTTTTVPETTTSTTAPVPPPATSAPAVCADRTPSGSAVQVGVINGDWNGDGTVDSALSWGEPTGGGADWYVRMQISGGTNSVVALGDLGAGFAAALGKVDVDFALGAEPGVNHDEMVAIVGSNAAGYNLGVFGTNAVGCAFQFDNGAGMPYEIPVHAAAATMSGMMCDGGMGSRFVVRLEAEAAAGTDWNVHYIQVKRTGEHSLSDWTVVDDAMSGASAVASFGRAECDGVVLIGPGGDY